jgi:hypothetical protein
MSTIRATAPATLRASALHSRRTRAEPSRNWMRYCIVRFAQKRRRVRDAGCEKAVSAAPLQLDLHVVDVSTLWANADRLSAAV